MRVLVVGPGAVGSFLGGTLAAGGADVTLLGRRAPGASGDEGTGRLRIEGPGGEGGGAGGRTVPVRRIGDPREAATPDLIVLAVKTYDLAAGLAAVARWPDSPAMTVQNGVGAEALAAGARTSPLLAASLTTAVEPVPGGVRRLRTGGMGIAAIRGDDAPPMAVTLAAVLTAAGLPARVYPDAVAMKWSKLLANLVGNATSAVLDMDPGDVYADRLAYPIERRQLHEAEAVMHGLGVRPVDLPGARVRLLLVAFALPEVIGRPVVAKVIGGARGGKSPSLRLHVRGGGTGPTEARWLNGAVADEARRLGLAAPVNACLAALVDEAARDPSRAAWFARRPDRLDEAVLAWAEDHAGGPAGVRPGGHAGGR